MFCYMVVIGSLPGVKNFSKRTLTPLYAGYIYLGCMLNRIKHLGVSFVSSIKYNNWSKGFGMWDLIRRHL